MTTTTKYGANPGSPSKPTDAFPIAPDNGSDLATVAQGLRVFAASPCVIRVTPLLSAADAYVDLSFPAGLWMEPLAVRKVWADGTTGSPVIHGYT